MNQLKFGIGNSKLGKNTLKFDLPAGHVCPFAKECRSCADRRTGRITDGRYTKYRCFGATSEAIYPNVRQNRWSNYELLQSVGLQNTAAMVELIDASLPDWNGLVRIHAEGGDFFNVRYFRAWCEIARRRPGQIVEFNGKKQILGTIFYAYSKAIPYIIRGEQPDNLRIVASEGGTHDALLKRSGYRTCKVVYSDEEAERLGLEIDHDDSHVWAKPGSFALKIHGTQPKGSAAGEAMKLLRKQGWYGYGKSQKKAKVLA